MANFCRKLFASVLVLAISVIGEPTKCYYCNTDADGPACNTPLNISAVRIQFCSNFTLDSGAIVPGSSKAGGLTSVCSKMTYVSQGNFVTIRECQSEELFDMPVCRYLEQMVPTAGVSSFTCSVCDTDLCNSSSPVYISFVVLMLGFFLEALF